MDTSSTCLVCGDSATNFNYGGFVCAGCRAFFRRNAFRMTEMRCSHKSKCIITVETRQHCRKCRLEKCFAVGMKKELIASRRLNRLPTDLLVMQVSCRMPTLSYPPKSTVANEYSATHNFLQSGSLQSHFVAQELSRLQGNQKPLTQHDYSELNRQLWMNELNEAIESKRLFWRPWE